MLLTKRLGRVLQPLLIFRRPLSIKVRPKHNYILCCHGFLKQEAEERLLKLNREEIGLRNVEITQILKTATKTYCGHGTGSKFLSGESLQMLPCRAAVLLMGCSSGRLVINGDFEASGLIFNYFLSGSGCVVANLWDVTDRDIDRYLESMIKVSLVDASSDVNLLDSIRPSRIACKFQYLIGAAPVVYGIPVRINILPKTIS